MKMKVHDIIFAGLAGAISGGILAEFLKELGFIESRPQFLGLLAAGAGTAIIAVQIVLMFEKKATAAQLVKHFLVGAVATVLDLKLFELSLMFLMPPLGAKGTSFLLSVLLKYAGNKYWAFEHTAKERLHLELGGFFAVTIVGLAIDIFIFYALVRIGPQFMLPSVLWTKFAVIMAAIIAAGWNFTGYKFLVFKK